MPIRVAVRRSRPTAFSALLPRREARNACPPDGGLPLAMSRVLTDALSRPVAVADARRSPSEDGIPAEPGFYTWWMMTDDGLPNVPPAPHPSDRDLSLLYLGIAPARVSSNANLRSRVIGQHLGGNLGSSTFRRSLAALLWEQQGWRPFMTPGGKVALTPEDNAALTRWQTKHLRVAWSVVVEPWAHESELIAEMSPPLNLAENHAHQFHDTMSQARARLMAAARSS